MNLQSLKNYLGKLDLQLIILSIVILILKLMIVNVPSPKLQPSECINPPFSTDCAFIFDEAHYIPAARKMMNGIAVNNEHPPLSKALIILGIYLFGDGPIGWRIFIASTGAVSVYLLGKLAYIVLGNRFLAISSAILFACDVTSFNLSSMAILDGPALMFSLLSAILFFQKRYVYSAISMGLALLSKISSLLILLALLLYYFLKVSYHYEKFLDSVREILKIVEKMVIISLAVLLAGLSVYDYSLKAYSTPFEHIDYIINYHSILTFKEGDIVHMPISWANPIMPFPRESYFVVTVKVDGKEYHPVAYYGMQTPLWWMTWLVFAFSIYSSYILLKRRIFPDVEALILSWITSTYLIYFPLAYLFHRWVYPFYFYSTVPIIAIGLSRILGEDKLSGSILIFMLGVQVAWFIVWFPVKPQWLIDLLLSLGLPA
ncbi:MAG: phospholipid carrier-dependent glycosyltransferase [Candidatus Caldarchaeales archaeon]